MEEFTDIAFGLVAQAVMDADTPSPLLFGIRTEEPQQAEDMCSMMESSVRSVSVKSKTPCGHAITVMRTISKMSHTTQKVGMNYSVEVVSKKTTLSVTVVAPTTEKVEHTGIDVANLKYPESTTTHTSPKPFSMAEINTILVSS